MSPEKECNLGLTAAWSFGMKNPNFKEYTLSPSYPRNPMHGYLHGHCHDG